MRKPVLVGASVLCWLTLGVAPGVGAPAQTASPTGARAACPVPPAAYRKGAKGAMWFAACVTCKTVGARELARRIHLSNTSASYVAHQYASRAVASRQFARYVALVGGKTTAKAIIYSGCMAGFRARRP